MSPSRTIASRQQGIHPRLEGLLRRHMAHPPRGPIAPYNLAAFELALAAWQAWGWQAPLILDTGCGVGMSTANLARHHPDHFVIGVDKSLDRLARGKPWAEGGLPKNCLLLRADLADFWRLMSEAGLRLARHYFLYPNPWPKPGQVQRRWQGHATFPIAVGLGGVIECRSNWRLYVEEFAFALELLTGCPATVEAYRPETPCTPFEKKYQASGHSLWRCLTDPETARSRPSILDSRPASR